MTNKTLDLELAEFIRNLETHVADSHLAKVMRSCSRTLERQHAELIHLYRENDQLRERLANAQQGLVEARDAILRLRGE
jgi:uncharacterized protein YigA (DUF484 family)